MYEEFNNGSEAFINSLLEEEKQLESELAEIQEKLHNAKLFKEKLGDLEPENEVLTDEDKRQLKEIALQSIKDSLDGKPIADFQTSLSSPLTSKCGAFVSLHEYGHLRGCIGHFGEDIPLHEIVAEMARAAAFEDPRFSPVRREELDDIDIEISVLTPMRRIKNLDEFELHRHGIYIRKGYRSGTFLPQVADEVDWTKEEFVGHCSQDKAGLGWNGWRDAELYVYEAIVF
jgi:AmmeMemoRadiSam system protein A